MLAQTLPSPAIDVMVPEKTQEATDCLPKAQSKLAITQPDGPDILTAQQKNLETQSPEKQVCDRAQTEDVSSTVPEISQPCLNLAEAASTELTSVEETLIREENDHVIMDQEFAFPFPDPASTLEIQGSARSDQGVQGTCSPSSSPVDHSDVNVLADTSLPNNPMGHNPQMHFPLISDPYDYELEKLRREEGDVRKNFEQTTLELMAELERKMAEARSEYDRKSKEIDVAYNAKAMEEEANMNLVTMSSVLANAFMFKGRDNSVTTDLAAAIRAVGSSQHSIQQQQAVETNTRMNPAPPQPSADAPIPNQSPRCNTTQPRLISQQAVAELNTLVNSNASPRPSVTSADAPIPNSSVSLPHFSRSQPRPISQKAIANLNTLLNSTSTPQPSVTAADTRIPNLSGPLSHSSTQQRPISQQAVAELNTLVNSTASPRPSGRAEALPLHLPRCNMPPTRPPPLITNINPLSSPPVHGTVRRPAPHLQRFRPSSAPSIAAAAAAASTTYPRLVQEQQQGKSNGDLVCLSDDD